MKCRYCNADVEQDAQFCPNCGKDLSKLKRCVKCGEFLDNDSMFCPHCGMEQPHKEVTKKSNSKKWIWVVGTLFLIGVLGGAGFLFFNHNPETQPVNCTENTNDVRERLDAILSVIVPDNDRIDFEENYFTEGFKEYYRRGCEKADKENCERPRIWWQYSDSDPQSYKINDVVKMGNEKVDALVTIIGELYQVDFSVILKKVDDTWLIDSITEKETVSSNSIEYESVLSERKLSESDLQGKTKKELEIMRNSVYARYGYRFKRDDLFNYFSQYSWYSPTTSDMSTIYNAMSDIEQYNVDFIKKHE